MPGHGYVGYAHGARIPRVAEWIGPEPIAFIGADLELGQIYFTVRAPYNQHLPTAYGWKWLHDDQWQYLGELPAYE